MMSKRMLSTLFALLLAASVAVGCSDDPADGDGDSDADADGDTDGDSDGDGDADGNDRDGDGIPDAVEDANGNGVVDPGESDPDDPDTDNDGILDGDEAEGDTDGDGIPDILESDTFDSDGDGTPDAVDSDHTDGDCANPPRLLDDVTLTTDTTLTAACSPYVISGNLVVAGGATLTIEASVEIHVRRAGWLTVGDGATSGALVASGTSATPIVFRSEEPSPAAGDWGGIAVQGTDHVLLEWCTISHAGMTGSGGEDERGSIVILGGGGVSVSNTTLSTGLGYGVYAVPITSPAAALFDEFSDNTISDCEDGLAVQIDRLGEIGTGNAVSGTIDVHGTEVTRDATWVDLGAPLRMIESSLQVGVGVTLTIDEGVEIIVPSEPPTLFEVYGLLVVTGTATNNVSISTESGLAGSWQGVYVDGSGSDLAYLWITGAGLPNWYLSSVGAALTLRELPISMEQVHVVGSTGYGIYLESPSCEGHSFDAVFESVADCSVNCYDDAGAYTCLVP